MKPAALEMHKKISLLQNGPTYLGCCNAVKLRHLPLLTSDLAFRSTFVDNELNENLSIIKNLDRNNDLKIVIRETARTPYSQDVFYLNQFP